MQLIVNIYLNGEETVDVVERWELEMGSVIYSLLSHVQLTKDDARLHFINAFTNMECKNGYGFSSVGPVRVWADAF